MDISWGLLIFFVISNFISYLLGRGDGQAQDQPLSEEARIEIAKYEIDKRYIFAGWLEERSGKHE